MQGSGSLHPAQAILAQKHRRFRSAAGSSSRFQSERGAEVSTLFGEQPLALCLEASTSCATAQPPRIIASRSSRRCGALTLTPLYRPS